MNTDSCMNVYTSRSSACHDSFICVTWVVHMCDITRSYAWHDSFICVTWHVHSLYPYKNTGWRRLIGSPKLQIIFHKRATKYRSLLRKMSCNNKGSCESSSPCTDVNLLHMQSWHTCIYTACRIYASMPALLYMHAYTCMPAGWHTCMYTACRIHVVHIHNYTYMYVH